MNKINYIIALGSIVLGTSVWAAPRGQASNLVQLTCVVNDDQDHQIFIAKTFVQTKKDINLSKTFTYPNSDIQIQISGKYVTTSDMLIVTVFDKLNDIQAYTSDAQQQVEYVHLKTTNYSVLGSCALDYVSPNLKP